MNKINPTEIYTEYQKGVQYCDQIGIFEDVRHNRNFYLGKQWEGVNAPSIELPVINIFRPAIDYYVAMLVSDDIGVTCEFPEGTDDQVKRAIEYVVSEMIDQVFEQTKFKFKLRQFVKNAALDGDAYIHWWYDPEKEYGTQIGGICAELIMNVNVIHGNPALSEIEAQPYLIVVSKLPTDQVKKMAKGHEEEITPDNDDDTLLEQDAIGSTNYTTVLTKLWKDDKTKTVWFSKSTRNVVLKDATNTTMRHYPLAKADWMAVPNASHGQSILTSVRQNQISINKLYMMINEFMKQLAFPKIIFDRRKIPNWTNKIQAIGVDGDPREAFVSQTPVVSLPPGIKDYAIDLIEKTKQSMGVYDVALGNVRPDNTSAIIALQKTASQPLELQRLDLYQMIEDSVRIIIDLMASYYGVRSIPFAIEEGEGQLKEFDFADLRGSFNYTVEVGQAAYWAETTQIQTLDNLYQAGIIPDQITYLEQLPNGVVKNKSDIIQALRAIQKAQQPVMPKQPQPLPTLPQ